MLRRVNKTSRKFITLSLLSFVAVTTSLVACSSSDSEEAPSSELTSEEGNSNLNENENENLNKAENTEFANNLSSEGGTAQGEQNATSNELTNLVQEGSQDAAGEPVADEGALNPGADPFANTPNVAGEQPQENPFAVGSNVPQNPAPAAEEAPAQVASAPGTLPETGSKMAYHVGHGDTLASIAKRIFGDGGMWKTLASENNLTDANKIFAGDVIYYTLNEKSQGFAESYEGSGVQTVTVGQGESLSQIAKKVYGTEAAWRTLWKQNPTVSNPDHIKVGATLVYKSAPVQNSSNVEESTEQADATETNTTTSSDLESEGLGHTAYVTASLDVASIADSLGIEFQPLD